MISEIYEQQQVVILCKIFENTGVFLTRILPYKYHYVFKVYLPESSRQFVKFLLKNLSLCFVSPWIKTYPRLATRLLDGKSPCSDFGCK